jgi:hypothetical protein
MASDLPSQNEGILSQGQGDRFDRWVEFLSAVLLSLATVLTAWCGYQAARWGGEQARLYNQASAARVRSAQAEGQARSRDNLNAALYVEYVVALSEDNQELADYLFENFPAELRTATEAWLARDPVNNPDAPPSPFELPDYRLPQLVEAEQLEGLAVEKFFEANDANERSDEYVLLTVIFATVLFFGGISGKFQWRLIDAGILGLGTVVFLGGLVLLLTLPIR